MKIGDKFGEWTVLNTTSINKKVKCVCSCGKEHQEDTRIMI